MTRICVVCEGQTEEEFVARVVAPAFSEMGLYLIPEMIETSPGHKGGALSYERVKRHVCNTLNQRSAPVVTTLFDLYRLDSRFPGFPESRDLTDLARRLETLTRALHSAVLSEVGCAPGRFIPYIQPHEFEALLFSDVATLALAEPGWNSAETALSAARTAAESPEHINHRPETKPAAHLERHLRHPNYRKRRHGPVVAEKIGLARMESECRFFAAWLATIRALAAPP